MTSDTIDNLMFCTKYRPSNINKVILLPRIHKILIDELTNDIELKNNLLLYSSYPGTGKTTVCKIIANKYDTLSINASFYSSVEDLRSVIHEFCNSMGDIFAKNTSIKVVFLDEFDGVSSKYQEALRGFIEENETRVRFVATCNNVSKLSGPLKSRFTPINFAPINQEETIFLKKEYNVRLNLIAKRENIKIIDGDLDKIINKSFPDFRTMLDNLQLYTKTGTTQSSTDTTQLYECVMKGFSTFDTYQYVINNWSDNVNIMFEMLGLPFAEYLFTKLNELSLGKVKQVTNTVYNYSSMLQSDPDPVLSALSLIYDLQEIFKNK
jgi:DNA polymerase III delta prime subunit